MMPTPLPVVSMMYFFVSASPLTFCIVSPASLATSTNHAGPECAELGGYGPTRELWAGFARCCVKAKVADNQPTTQMSSIRLPQQSPGVMNLFSQYAEGDALLSTCNSITRDGSYCIRPDTTTVTCRCSASSPPRQEQ